jgi:hypothetical protein
VIGLSVAVPLGVLALTTQRHVGVLTWQRVLAVLGGLSLALAVLALSARRLPR